MWWLAIFFVQDIRVTQDIRTEQPQRVRAAMAASIEKQRASVEQQRKSIKDPAPPAMHGRLARVLADRPRDVTARNVAEDPGDDNPYQRRVRPRDGTRGQRAPE